MRVRDLIAYLEGKDPDSKVVVFAPYEIYGYEIEPSVLSGSEENLVFLECDAEKHYEWGNFSDNWLSN